MKNSTLGHQTKSQILQSVARAGAATLPGLVACLCAIAVAATLLPGWSGDEAVIRRFPVTLLLAVTTLAIAIPLGFALGVAAARQPRGLPGLPGLCGRLMDGLGPAMLSVLPAAMLAPLAAPLSMPAELALNKALPGGGPALLPLMIAVLAIALPLVAYMTRISRRGYQRASVAPSLRTAQGLGLPDAVLNSRFASPLALASTAPSSPLLAVTAIAIAAIVETLLHLPGLGQLLLSAARDGAVGPVVAAMAAACALALLAKQAAAGFVWLLDPVRGRSPGRRSAIPRNAVPVFHAWRNSPIILVAFSWLLALAVAALAIPLLEDGTGLGQHPAAPVFAALWAARYSLLFVILVGGTTGLVGCLAAVFTKQQMGRSGEVVLLKIAERLSRLPLLLLALMLAGLGNAATGIIGAGPWIGMGLAIVISFVPPVMVAALTSLPDPHKAEFIVAARADGLSEQTITHKHWLVSLRRPLIAAALPAFPRILAFELAAGLCLIPLPGWGDGAGWGALLGDSLSKAVADGGGVPLDSLAPTLLLALTGWALWKLASGAAEAGR